MSNQFSTNVNDYTLAELMAIIDVQELSTKHILTQTNYYIQKYKTKDPMMAVFFKDIQSQLIQYAQSLEDDESEDDDDENADAKIIVEGFGTSTNEAVYPSGDKQITNWYQNEVLTQNDPQQTSKITDRKQKIQIFNNPQVPMNREQIATTDTYEVPVKQDSLNPNLKNTINRFINLDSQFRQYTSGVSSVSTDYTCDLSDTLRNVLSLSLYSYQIPFSWYAIDTAYGNNCFWIVDPSSEQVVNVSIPSGNYSQDQFKNALNRAFTNAGFGSFPRTDPVAYNTNNGLITLQLFGGVWTDPQDASSQFVVSTQTQIVFFDFTGTLQCNVGCLSKSNHYFNNTLGWSMGFRFPYYQVLEDGNTASCVLDINGTKYLILVIDDFNQNHVNNSLVSISQFNNTLKIPSYYSTDIPYTCITPQQQGNNLSSLVEEMNMQNLGENGLLLAGKYQQDYTPTQIVLPSAPRTLTNAQLYTINSVNNNNNNLTNYLAKAPTSSDILAIIPVKTSAGVPTGSLLVEFSGSLQDSVRTYFGPVNIDRFAVKLLDDKGNVINLNGTDWCVSLIAECLYQY
ncbi:MAG: hypothetical protein ACOVRN_16915 [Flavobacterium sp.]